MNAEKQLIQWLSEIGVEVNIKSAKPPPIQMSHAHPHSIQTGSITLKEERNDCIDVKSIDAIPQGYIPPSQIVYSPYSRFGQVDANQSEVNNVPADDSANISKASNATPVCKTIEICYIFSLNFSVIFIKVTLIKMTEVIVPF